MKKILFIAVIFLALACSKKSDTQIECVICYSATDPDGSHARSFCGMPDEVSAFVEKTEKIPQWNCRKEK